MTELELGGQATGFFDHNKQTVEGRLTKCSSRAQNSQYMRRAAREGQPTNPDLSSSFQHSVLTDQCGRPRVRPFVSSESSRCFYGAMGRHMPLFVEKFPPRATMAEVLNSSSLQRSTSREEHAKMNGLIGEPSTTSFDCHRAVRTRSERPSETELSWMSESILHNPGTMYTVKMQ